MSDAPRPMPEILAELQSAVDEVSAESLRYGYIADTIRVNALRHGATTEQVEDFIHGRTSFVNWMADVVQRQSEAQAAEIAALRAERDAAVIRAWEMGRDAVAKVIAKRAEEYDIEHGQYDYSTDTTEYPGNGSEWMEEWEELEELTRALTPPADLASALATKGDSHE